MINICVYAFVILNLFDGCLARVGITPLGAGCRNLDFECFDGKCIPYNQVCDGLPDCSDGADEKLCNRLDDDSALVDFIGRDKRQTTRKCGSGKWQCKDGTCIAVDEKCDGQVNCKDGTDESFATCRLGKCPSYLFRCAYGACVDGTAKCNGVQECRDNSDELHLDCLPKPTSKKCGVKFQCNSGECIPPYERCDGVADCEDGSDETVTQCGGNKCSSYLFRCAYGACVDGGSDCNTVIDCADGSDENYELCGTEPPTTTTTTTTTTTQKPTRTKQPTKPPVIQPTGNNCVTPPYSAGSYFVQPDNAYGANEEVPEFTTIIFDCGSSASLPGGLNFTVCLGGQWTTEPLCKRKCRPLNSLTVTYVCKDTEGRVVDCSAPVEQGTTAIPTCKPSYVAANVLPAMECLEGGSWDNSVSCTPGVVKTGFKLIFLISEKVQFFISTHQYTAPVLSDDTVKTTIVISNSREDVKPESGGTLTGPFDLSDLISFASRFSTFEPQKNENSKHFRASDLDFISKAVMMECLSDKNDNSFEFCVRFIEKWKRFDFLDSLIPSYSKYSHQTPENEDRLIFSN